MPRKSKSKEPVQGAETTATTAVMEPPPGTSVDVQIDTPVEPVMVAGPAPSEPAPSFVERLSERSGRALVPDPFLLALDNAAGVRLYENRQARVMAIQFDEKPSQPVIDLIKEAEFRWNPKDRVWTKPVRGDLAMATRIDAERVYQEARKMIRQDKGVDAEQGIPF